MMQQTEKNRSLVLRIAAVLLCLILISLWMLGDMYARYTTDKDGSDGARVAAFAVTETGEATKEITADVKPGDTETYDVTVTNQSETAIHYEIAVENKYNNLPLECQMLDSNDNEITQGDIAAGDSSKHTYKLRITWPKNQNDASYAGKTDQLVVKLSAVQTD